MSIRFGTTVQKERDRVLRMAKRYALHQRWAQERYYLTLGYGSSQWNDQERQFLIQTPPTKFNNYQPSQWSNGPLRIDYYHQTISQMYDDASNVMLNNNNKKQRSL